MRRTGILFLPILRIFSVIGLAVFGLSGDGIQFAPSLPFGPIQFPLLFFRKLLIGDKLIHIVLL